MTFQSQVKNASLGHIKLISHLDAHKVHFFFFFNCDFSAKLPKLCLLVTLIFSRLDE